MRKPKPPKNLRATKQSDKSILVEWEGTPTLADNIVTEARSWKNTPFQHQGRLKGLGVDCAGFVAMVAQNAGLTNVEIPHDYKPREDGTAMMGMLSQHLDFVPTEEAKPGDVLALCDEMLRDPDIPRHLAFVTEVRETTMFIIHASSAGVREHRTNTHWRSRIHSCWRVKESSGVKVAISDKAYIPLDAFIK